MSNNKGNMKKILNEFLEDNDKEFIPQFEKENLILEPLLDEIDAIKEESIRDFVRSALLKNKTFWIIPSSFSETQHPPDEHDVGGNVLHTQRVFRICALLADSHMLDAIERDILLAAALLHDVTKGVLTGDDELPVYDEFHPYTVDRFIRQVKVEDEIRGAENESTMLFLQEDHAHKILRIIRCHMGVWCVDEETDILTAQGWKNYSLLNIGEEVLTLNHATGLSEWQCVQNIHVFPAESRQLILMEGNEFSSLTTPNHRWPIEKPYGRERHTYLRQWATSEEIAHGSCKNQRILIAAQCSDVPDEAKWADALVEIIAWWWTEGSFKYNDHGGLTISQSDRVNHDNVIRIRSALNALFGSPVEKMFRKGYHRGGTPPCWREDPPNGKGQTIFYLSSKAEKIITEHFCEKTLKEKVISSEFIRSLTLSQLNLFIDISLLGDRNKLTSLSQKSSLRSEQFALACILAGRGVSLRKKQSRVYSYSDNEMTTVSILSKKHVYPQTSNRIGSTFNTSVVTYDGHVWCPTTPNQTWLARRKGSIYFTGNSPIPETYPVTDLEMILYTADTIASRLHWIIDGDEMLIERWVF